MNITENKFRSVMAAAAPCYGLFLGLPGTSGAEILAAAGFDWLLVDHEHAPFELSDILAHLQAMAPYDVAPIVRPVDDSPSLLKKMLDIGVQTFLVPMVDTPEQAERIVRSLRYPPAGVRGVGTSLARAAAWGQITDYVHRANDEICLLVQAETTEALANLPGILEVEGVEGVFIGPSDLSASMGHVGNPGHPEVVAAVGAALSTISAAGKYAGIFCLDPALAQSYRERGANFIGVGVDTMMLAQGARELVRRFNGMESTAAEPQAGY